MTKYGEAMDRWEEALSWHMTLRESEEATLTNAVGREWQLWYSEAENRRIFDHLSQLLVERGLYRDRPRLSREEIEADRYDLSVPIAEWRKTQASHQMPKHRARPERNLRWLPWGFTAPTLAALAALVTLGPIKMVRRADRTPPIVYRTDIGGLKDVHLPDGSSVILGGRSQLSVAFTRYQRSVNLIQGQAWFRVVHNSRWPFVVTAGNGIITDVGTSFIITRNSDRVVVTVTEGRVAVSVRPLVRASASSDQKFSASIVLAPIPVTGGEQFAFADDGVIGVVKSTDVHADTAWTQGRLMFHDQPLRYVVEAVDRYSSRKIAVTPSAGALRFSGIIHEDEVNAWLQGLAKIFPIAVAQRGSADCIHMQDPGLSGSQSCPP